MGLARQPGNEVKISYRKEAFTRLKSRNQVRLEEMLQSSDLVALMGSEVERIETGRVLLNARQEEGDGSVITVGPDGDHFKPDFPDSKPNPYRPDWRAVKQFTRPWIVHSGNDLDWETDKRIAGRFVKWLSDDQAMGFRAQLIKIPPGWTPPDGSQKTYFKNANRLRYMVHGSMKVWSFEAPDSRGTATRVMEDFFIYQPPRSIWGYGSGPVTEEGAIWLEVTYAQGLAVGGGPLEEPSVAR